MDQVSGGPEGHDLTRAKPVCSRHILVRPAFKMRVYLGRIVELDREPTYEVGPKLAIYRSAAGCDERRGRRGGQRPPECIIDIRQPSSAAISVAMPLAAPLACMHYVAGLLV